MKKGFTLIELMIVVVIIGILAAIAIPNFVQIIDKAKISSVKANMHTTQVTVETKAVDLSGAYCIIDSLESGLPQNFKNPYVATETGIDAIVGLDAAPDETTTGTDGTDDGRVGYYTDATDVDGTTYSIVGFGKGAAAVGLLLVPGTTE